uniref:39S ribosomal protein L52, mitochondrial n=1 Tax=Caenorhabditis tropicalis TaxID=1561998 RepID=A0A1I7TA97_9PELO
MAIRLVQHPRNQRRKELEFSIQDPNKPHRFVRGNTVPAWTREFSILRKLARKRSLEERITVREESLAKELEDLENELTAEGVRMIDGIMTVQEEL